MEEKNKSKNAGGVAIIFIIGVLIIALICCLIYIKQISDKLLLENDNYNKNTQQIIDENINKETKGIEVLGVGKNFIKIEEASEVVLDGYENKYCSIEYDLDKDGVKDKISLEYCREDIYSEVIINGVKMPKVEGYAPFILYIIDLEKDDSSLEIVLYSAGDVPGCAQCYFLDYKNNKLIDLTDILADDLESDYIVAYSEIYVDQNGRLALINPKPFYGQVYLVNYYFNYNNNTIQAIKIDLSKELPKEMIIKKDSGYLYTFNQDVRKVCEDYLEKATEKEDPLEECGIYSFEEDIKVQVIEKDGYSEIIKAKLENGQIIYMFPINGYLAG